MSKTKMAPTASAPAFRKLEDHPAYRVAADKLAMLIRERDELRADLQSRVAAFPSPQHRVAAILRGEPLDDVTRSECEALEVRIADYDAAVTQQRMILEDVRRDAQRELSIERVPQHREIGLRIHACLLALRDALEEESRFLREAKRDGCSSEPHLRPFGFGDFHTGYDAGKWPLLKQWQRRNRERLGLEEPSAPLSGETGEDSAGGGVG